MGKIVSARIPEEWADHIRILQDLGEIKNIREIIETGLEVYRPSGISAREYQKTVLERRLRIRQKEIELELEKIQEKRDKELQRIRGNLRALMDREDRIEDEVKKLIPRWLTTIQLNVYGKIDPYDIISENTSKNPKGEVEFFKPFGIRVTWEELEEIYFAWADDKEMV